MIVSRAQITTHLGHVFFYRCSVLTGASLFDQAFSVKTVGYIGLALFCFYMANIELSWPHAWSTCYLPHNNKK